MNYSNFGAFHQYSKIGSAAYGVNWYDLSGNKAVALVMIITMSHYPPKLTAGKFVDLSINTFGVVSFLIVIVNTSIIVKHIV